MNRRSFVAGLGTVAVAANAIPASSQSLVSLASLGRSKEIDIGTSFEPFKRSVTIEETEQVRRHCSLITPEFSFKQEFNEKHGYTRAQEFSKFADENSLKKHGHPVYFAMKDPRPRNLSRETLVEKQRRFATRLRRLRAVMPDAVSWDVLNEVVAERPPNSGRSPILNDPTLASEDRMEFLSFLLSEAREIFGKDAQLALNENNLFANSYNGKRKDVLATVRALLDRGAPLDAVGIQSHLTSKESHIHDDGKPNFEQIACFIEQLSKLNLAVYISELDLKNYAFSGSQAEKDEKHAEYLSAYLSTVLAYPNVKRLVFWGLSDKGHELSGAGEKLGCERKCTRPTLFDEHHQPKQAFHAVANVLRSVERVSSGRMCPV